MARKQKRLALFRKNNELTTSPASQNPFVWLALGRMWCAVKPKVGLLVSLRTD